MKRRRRIPSRLDAGRRARRVARIVSAEKGGPGVTREGMAETLLQMNATGLAIAEAVEDCLLAGDEAQAQALLELWVIDARARAKCRRDLGIRPRLHRKRLDLTAKAVAKRAAEIYAL